MQRTSTSLIRKNSKNVLPHFCHLMARIWQHLSRKRRIQVLLAMLLMLLSSLAEMISLSAVVPFLASLTDPGLLWQISFIRKAITSMGIVDVQDMFVAITLLFGITALFAAGVRLLNLWLNSRLAAHICSDISCESYFRTLHQPYAVHVSRNSSKVISSITMHIVETMQALNAMFQLVTASLVSFSIVIVLYIIDWRVALISTTVFSVAYLLILAASKKKLEANSRLVSEASENQLKALQEGLGAIRDVLLENSQNMYLSIYQKADLPMRLSQAQNGFLSAYPRYLLESVGLILIAGLALWLRLKGGNTSTVIAVLGSLALGSQRLLPSFQQVYSSLAQIRALESSMLKVFAMLDQPVSHNVISSRALPLELSSSILLQSLSFRYENNSPWILRDVDLVIRKGERVGIVGRSGAGKSTLVDVIMGLLTPCEGKILVDDIDLHDEANPERVLSWRAAIAHVPQNIFLTDSSVSENIAFGEKRELVDRSRLVKAAEQAQIASFIESLPQSYDTFVGERGIRLSGGQRQRIGIARALYKGTSVLIFDEATSALDTETENSIMSTIEDLSRELTIVMIAHRLSSLRNCDRIIDIHNIKTRMIS
jgi:ABC-type multidrug transport system fused ATPase/permease subunit